MDSAVIAREYGPMISSLAYQFFGSRELAQDAVQEAWVEILRALPQFRGESTLKTWVYSVAWRRMLRLKKRDKTDTLRTLKARYHQNELVGPASFGPEARYWAEETCRKCMTGVLFCLTSEQRLAFLFRYTAELPYDEIAEILETTPEASRKLYSRARQLIATFITSDCTYSRPDAKCAYGADRWTRPSGLNEAFAKLGSFGSAVAAYRIQSQVMPGPNFWESYLEPSR